MLFRSMNMLLHEVDKPNIVRTNPLSRPFREISERDQYDIIMTNPPFGGEEEEGTSKNMPQGLQTSDTALEFLVFIMLSLKEKGRCAIILPNGPMFASGVAAKIKEKLLSEFNLHTIIRLPETVFEPYTTVATNILFFDKTNPTKEIWYYQMKVAERLRGATRAKNPKYTTFIGVVPQEFEPKANDEWKDYCWVEAGNWPNPMHPGVAAALRELDIPEKDRKSHV